ncbi:beta-mannosidase [candidate division KSB1 bacterium]|nr:beta-mannosidase [candidate division KSB1 bacterium]
MRFFKIFLIIFLCFVCKSKEPTKPVKKFSETNDFLVDRFATAETIALFENLKQLSNRGVMFGHQDDLAYGVGWQAENGRSDIKSVCGDYPAVTGWDLGDIQKQSNLDGVDFEKMKQWIRETHARGGITALSMHLDNPVTLNNAWDNTPAVAAILPDGNRYKSYLKILDQIAGFLADLVTDDGICIPVVFRPYHEHNHSWSWWGSSACTVDEYNALWKMTVEYLRDTHELHHLLYAISPQEVNSESQYLARYPGDDFVDIFGMDDYRLWNRSQVNVVGKSLEIIVTLAEKRDKIAALTEVGVENVPFSDWWSNYLLAAIEYSNISRKIAWALVWRNASETHFFAPYPGHPSAADFIEFYKDPFTIFQSQLPDMYH